MKRRIADFLVWLLHKLAPYHIELQKQYLGTEKLEVSFSKYIPRDGAWHQVSVNLSLWMLAGNPEVLKRDKDTKMFVDGAVVAELSGKADKVGD